jgi:putative isomerase
VLHGTLPLEWAWNTWDSGRPAAMAFLPLGLRVTPVAYAASVNGVSHFSPGEGTVLGRRALDGSLVELTLEHAGTRLAWIYEKPDAFALRGRWQAGRLGEWGLRFWVLLCFSAEGGITTWRYDPEARSLAAAIGHRHVVVASDPPPLMATFHESCDALEGELVEKGYFFLGSRGTEGRLAALRFNLEEAPSCSFVLAMADAPGLAAERARELVAAPPAQTVGDRPAARSAVSVMPPPRCGACFAAPGPGEGASAVPTDASAFPTQTGDAAGALDAVRDVIGWNTVWDPVNGRPYTALSRHWNAQKFGGFGVWLDDVLYHALMAGLFDGDLARANLSAVMAGRTPQGNLPCLLTGNDAWVDRSQPPIGAFVVWCLFLRLGRGAHDLLAAHYPGLAANHAWWRRERAHGYGGLAAYGTSAVGSGLYAGTKLGAKNESSMDNSPVHDEAMFDAATRTLDAADVGLNSLLALDAEMLALIAAALGLEAEAAAHARRAGDLHERIRVDLWDESRGVFANRLRDGRFVRALAPTSFYPLAAGAAEPEQARTLLDRHLDAPSGFGGVWRLPSVSREDPAFGDNVYWRGRVWPPLNFWVYQGLRRYGFDGAAGALARDGFALFRQTWAWRRCPENFNASTGEAFDQPDTDPFYGWGALLPYLAVAEVCDVNPWGGWELGNAEGDVGPLLTPIGRTRLRGRGGVLTVLRGERAVLAANVGGRLREVAIGPDRVSLLLPPDAAKGRWIDLSDAVPDRVLFAECGGAPLKPRAHEAGTRLTLPPGDRSRRLTVVLRGA